MKKNILLIILLAFPLFCFAQDAVTHATPKHQRQSLTLTIKSDKKVYDLGEEIRIELYINNTSNASFFLAGDDISLEVVDKSEGINFIAPFFTPTYIPKEHKLLEIKPRSSFKKVFNFEKWQINIQEKGKHLGTAYYVGEFPNRYLIKGKYVYQGSTIAAMTFPGPLISNAITIEVQERKDLSQEKAIDIAKKAIRDKNIDVDKYYLKGITEFQRNGRDIWFVTFDLKEKLQQIKNRRPVTKGREIFVDVDKKSKETAIRYGE